MWLLQAVSARVCRQCTCRDCVPDDYDRLLLPDDVSHVLAHEFPHNYSLLRSLLNQGGAGARVPLPSSSSNTSVPPRREHLASADGLLLTKRGLLTLGMNRLSHLLFDDARSRGGQVWTPKFAPPTG